jgi:hypothetical protein
MTINRSTNTDTTTQGSSKVTTNHDEIKKWAEERGATPSSVIGTGGKDAGVLRLMFPGYAAGRSKSLREISWEDFFNKFEENNLAFIYQNKTIDGTKSNFNKFIKRK